jgi:hypothetical protein
MDMKRVFSTERSRVRASYLLKIESLILFGIVIYLLIAPFISDVSAPAALSAEIVFGTLAGLGLWFSAKAFDKQKSFGRAPAVLANLIALGVSYYMITGKLYFVGIPLALLAVTTLVSAALGYSE